MQSVKRLLSEPAVHSVNLVISESAGAICKACDQ